MKVGVIVLKDQTVFLMGNGAVDLQNCQALHDSL